MQQPWNPPTPIEVLFTQLDDGIAFAEAGGETYSTTHVVRTGYEIIAANGLFTTPCREWRQKPQAEKTMNAFQEHFSLADMDRLSNTTTGEAGYQGATNHTEEDTTAPVDHAANQAKLIADTIQEQIALAMANINLAPATSTTPRRDCPTVYCWTHGISKNIRHTSELCENRAPGHKTEATKVNNMGGSTRVAGRCIGDGR
jgi:phage-related tail fiber protein